VEVSRVFPVAAASSALARNFVTGVLAPHACDLETARLLASELATNALRHAGTDFAITVTVHGGVARVGVSDDNDDLPTMPADIPSEAVSGRGLRLVDALARSWGVTRAPAGKTVWFELDCWSSALDAEEA
jgi:anti-sigma regulatory factor (Ser/Thr protein kinase)